MLTVDLVNEELLKLKTDLENGLVERFNMHSNIYCILGHLNSRLHKMNVIGTFDRVHWNYNNPLPNDYLYRLIVLGFWYGHAFPENRSYTREEHIKVAIQGISNFLEGKQIWPGV